MKDESRVRDYGHAWADVMQRVRQGYSWSGNERNCAYLNGGKPGAFSNVSSASGFDFPDDGRAMALCDWDQDGDIDVWMRNRSAPRLRLLLNQCEGKRAVALKLQGVKSNRDGIGAVVRFAGQTKSVRAGEMFLSQSSKWLHFGGDAAGEVSVRWPGGVEEKFSGVEAGGRYLLKEGSGNASAMPARTASVALKPGSLPTETGSAKARIVFPARVPMPEVRFRDKAAQLRALPADGQARLLVLWSARCEHCVRALKAWTKSPPKVPILALSVDQMEDGGLGEVYVLMDEIQPSFVWGMIEQESLGHIAKLQEALFDGAPPLLVPMVFLLDGKGAALAQYRGDFSAAGLDADAGRLLGASALDLHHWAAPVAGTWFTNPVDQAWYSDFVRRAIEGR